MPTYWEIVEHRGSAYHVNFAQVSGILFVSLPFQSYYSRCGEVSAMVSHPKQGTWNAMVLSEVPNGKSVLFEDASFANKDEAFYWAAGEMMVSGIEKSRRLENANVWNLPEISSKSKLTFPSLPVCE